VFAFDFETRIKTILPLISCLINKALLVADHVSIRYCFSSLTSPLVSDKHVPVYRFQTVFPGSGALVCVVFTQPGWKWMMQITVMSCCSNSCCQTSAKVRGDFCFPVHHACARALSCCDTRLRTSHQTRPPNRSDLSSVDYRLLTVIQECVYQKQQGMSNIVDELWLSTEWHFINRMTHYISQGRVEAPIRIGGQLCYSFVANLLQYLYAKIIEI